MIPSGNDAAYCLAENFGAYLYFESVNSLYKIKKIGDFDIYDENLAYSKDLISFFLNEMNRVGKELGLTNTLFANVHGLDN